MHFLVSNEPNQSGTGGSLGQVVGASSFSSYAPTVISSPLIFTTVTSNPAAVASASAVASVPTRPPRPAMGPK